MLLTHAPLNIFQIFYDVHFVVDWRSYSAHYPPDALVADALEVATGYLRGRWKYIAVR